MYLLYYYLLSIIFNNNILCNLEYIYRYRFILGHIRRKSFKTLNIPPIQKGYEPLHYVVA